MEKVKQEVGFKGNAEAVLRLHPHRSQVQDEEPRGADPGLLRHRQEGRCQAPAIFLDLAQGASSKSGPTTRISAKNMRPAAAMNRERPTARALACSISTPTTCQSRTTPGKTTLYLHEGAPGHHFQISLAQENEALPCLHALRWQHRLCRRLGALCRNTRLTTWASTRTPISTSARLIDEMLRAMRLVVDTGIHTKGWTREQAIKYMIDHSEHGQNRRHRRSRALYRHPQPGAGL